MEVLGVLSGVGHLPVEVARTAKELGYLGSLADLR